MCFECFENMKVNNFHRFEVIINIIEFSCVVSFQFEYLMWENWQNEKFEENWMFKRNDHRRNGFMLSDCCLDSLSVPGFWEQGTPIINWCQFVMAQNGNMFTKPFVNDVHCPFTIHPLPHKSKCDGNDEESIIIIIKWHIILTHINRSHIMSWISHNSHHPKSLYAFWCRIVFFF